MVTGGGGAGLLTGVIVFFLVNFGIGWTFHFGLVFFKSLFTFIESAVFGRMLLWKKGRAGGTRGGQRGPLQILVELETKNAP